MSKAAIGQHKQIAMGMKSTGEQLKKGGMPKSKPAGKKK